MRNPFQYGKIAEKENFIDRDVDRAFLKQALYSSQNVILISPRRWGKSSLVHQAMSELVSEKTDVKIVYIDAFPIKSSAAFYQLFAKEVLKATSSHWQNVVDMAGKFLKSISPRISFGADPAAEFSLSIDIRSGEEDVREVLNLPEKIAKEKGIQVIVCIDEFQELAKLPDYETLESQLRSVWQYHQSVSYCLYGSQKHMMSDIFNSPAKPFYKFGQIYPLAKIDPSDWNKYISDRFESTAKHISQEYTRLIIETVQCNSWYVQQLSSAVWNFTTDEVDGESFRKALLWCIDVNAESYRQLCNGLTEKQINLLRAIADGRSELSSTETMTKYSLGTSATVTKNKRLLLKDDVLDLSEGALYFQDPIFEIWFKEKF